PAAEVQDGEDDDLIEVEATFSLPDATERESTLMGGQPTEPGHKAPLDGIEKLDGKGAALVVGQGKIKVVTASRPSHRSSPPGGCWVEGPTRTEASCGEAGEAARRSRGRQAPGSSGRWGPRQPGLARLCPSAPRECG